MAIRSACPAAEYTTITQQSSAMAWATSGMRSTSALMSTMAEITLARVAAAEVVTDGGIRGQRRGSGALRQADRRAAVRPRERLGRGAAGRIGAERVPRVAHVGRVRRVAP